MKGWRMLKPKRQVSAVQAASITQDPCLRRGASLINVFQTCCHVLPNHLTFQVEWAHVRCFFLWGFSDHGFALEDQGMGMNCTGYPKSSAAHPQPADSPEVGPRQNIPGLQVWRIFGEQLRLWWSPVKKSAASDEERCRAISNILMHRWRSGLRRRYWDLKHCPKKQNNIHSILFPHHAARRSASERGESSLCGRASGEPSASLGSPGTGEAMRLRRCRMLAGNQVPKIQSKTWLWHKAGGF